MAKLLSSGKDIYKRTIQTYEKLGSKYTKGIKNIKVKEFPEFVKILPKGGRVLDIGCATGRDSKRFLQKGFKVVGIDLVDSFLREARSDMPQAKFIKMDLFNLNFPSNYFDAVWANAVLLHIKKKDIPKALKGFYKILKSKGKLHIRVKQGKGARYKAERLSVGEKRLFVYFSSSELERLVKKAGFSIIITRIFPDELRRKDVKWISLWAEK
ncbi:MAG: methyltransferase type 11 [Parcubacteria group bacterium Gr01-1014_30]|nr:MAG: methyltransferase type 11 [Parcubacteria group bacterium Gr01-1014_30]